MKATTPLPSGTVTFMFTDIEGSTRLLQEAPEGFRALLARHDALIREALRANGGVEVRNEGDAFFAAFVSAPSALAAAIDIQRDMRALAPLRVRIGLHTGDAVSDGADYPGQLAVHAAARVSDAANGEQILLSEQTRALVDGVFDDVGEHTLKGLAVRMRLFRVAHPDLAGDRRPPRTPTSTVRLPAVLSSFVGRERERDEVARALGAHRLVTLTGAGGSGKTRLAIECARALATETSAIAFVDLSMIAAHESVGTAFTDAFELQPPSGTDPLAAAIEHLGSSHALLVLDNCEQVLDGAGHAAARVLEACPSVRIVATSREPLGVAGETILRVPSLSLPDGGSVELVSASEAGRLFIERARERDAAFTPSESDAAAVAQICRRLDGIPLAIELAAARLGVLSPSEIAKRLDDQFGLLAAGSSRIERQRTLRATIDWSHRLLDDGERTLLRRLAVFGGPFSLEAAEHVADLPGTLDLLGSLVDKSLVLADRFETSRSFRLLETIRQYAAEKLADTEDLFPARDRHLSWYVTFAEQARDGIQGPDARRWLDHVELELDNIRLALTYARDRDDGVSAARIIVALERFWLMRAYLPDADAFAEPLDHHPAVTGALHVRLLHTLCTIARWVGAHPSRLASYVERAHDESRALDDDALLAWSHYHDAFRGVGGADPERAALAERGVEHARRTGDPHLLARCLVAAGLYWSYTDNERATERCREAERIAGELGDIQTLAMARAYLARLMQTTAEQVEGFAEVIAIGRTVDDRWLVPWITVWRAGSLPAREAIGELEHAVALLQKVGQRPQALSARYTLAEMCLRLGDLDAAERWITQVIDAFRGSSSPTGLEHRSVAVLAAIRLAASKLDEAEDLCRRALEQGVSPEARLAFTGVLVEIAIARGDFERARDICEEMLGWNFVSKDAILRNLASAEQELGNHQAARAALARSLTLGGYWTDAVEVAESAAEILAEDRPEDAARYLGFARAAREERATPVLPAEHRRRQEALAARLGEHVDLRAAMDEGARLTDAEIVPSLTRLLDEMGVTPGDPGARATTDNTEADPR